MSISSLYIVILAGGQGQRLWPLSRQKHPKQLLPFKGKASLLKLTIDRLQKLPLEKKIWVMTNQTYQETIHNAYGHKIDHILVEPAARNTAPAILLTCQKIKDIDPHALILFLPADHYIQDEKCFIQTIQKSITCAYEQQKVTLIGLQPTYPATGYGYIRYQPPETAQDYAPIMQFYEKPSLTDAQQLVQEQNTLWNVGMFCAPMATFINLFQRYAPKMYQQMQEYLDNNIPYTNITDISFDHAIMEKHHESYVIPADFDWSDVGDLDTFLSLQNKPHDPSTTITINAHNNLISADQRKIIALIGVDNLCIIDTPDALLIAKKTDAQQVKNVVQALKQKNQTEYL